ncbi:MAG TPA: serine hydrolase domain-containing protein, partial [Chloroflexota bacterium]|nr:serine hydrolase domain-containing protein [Chloroflexota bacterium]
MRCRAGAATLLLLCALLTGGISSVGASAGPMRRDSLSAFVNRVLPRDLRRSRVPGAVFVMVRGSHVVYARGYGYADAASRIRVNMNTTEFDAGPSSATITTAAVMQLVERGRLALHVNVNRYLRSLKVPVASGKITLSDLLTSTAGFGDIHIGRLAAGATSLEPLASYVRTGVQDQIFPPGHQFSYSPLDASLAGVTLEDVTHIPFASYVEGSIFGPLQMSHSSFAQALPPNLQPKRATGYDTPPNQPPQAAPANYFNLAPGEGMVTSGMDMAHFLIALLSGGRFAHNRILSARTIAVMEAGHFTSYPALPGFPHLPSVAYGFERYWPRGQLFLEATGAVRGFSSTLGLLPSQHVGFFLASNSGNAKYISRFVPRLLDHYLPPGGKPLRHPTFRSLRPAALIPFVGSYWSNQYASNTVEKLRQAVEQMTISAEGTNALVAHFWSGRIVHLRRVARDMFEAGRGNTASFWNFHFHKGQVAWVAAGSNQIFDTVPWYWGTNAQSWFVAVFIAVYLSGLALWIRPRALTPL